MVSVGLGGTGGTRLKVDRHQREQQGEEVGKIMARFGEQRQRMSADPGHHQEHDIGQSHGQRDLKYSRRPARAMNTHVHISSVRAYGTGFKQVLGSKPTTRARNFLTSYGLKP